MPERFSCKHWNLSGIVWTPIWYVTLHFRDRRGSSVTEITPNSPSLSVNRSRIWYGFRAGCKAILYSVKISLDFWGIGSGILCICTHLIRYRVNIALDFWGIGSGILCVCTHLIRYRVNIALDFWGIGSGILCACTHLIRYRVNIALDFWGIGSGILCVGTHLIGSINLFTST